MHAYQPCVVEVPDPEYPYRMWFFGWVTEIANPEWGGPGTITFPTLQDWTHHKEEGIKYYSGIATYRMSFDLPGISGKRVYLDLGSVHEMAEVTLNGKKLGVVWCAPWQIEISDALKAKGNRLEFREFGVFDSRVRAARIAQNPKTLEKVEVPAKRTVKFKMGRLMKEHLSAMTEEPAETK